jgi:arylsulfatase A-like enzyme
VGGLPLKIWALILAVLASLMTVAALPPGPQHAAHAAPQTSPADPPNILFIVTDDQRGGLQVMPRTRQLFQHEGRRFPNGFVTTPLCCPSRTSIMTGLYAHNHGIIDNVPDRDQQLRDDTLQARLSELGYTTAVYGKFLNKWPVAQDPPDFDDFAVMSHAYKNSTWNVNGTVAKQPGYTTNLVGHHAVDFVEAQASSGQPWMMYVHPYAPHLPATPEPEFSRAKVAEWRGNPAVLKKDRSGKPGFVRRATTSFREGRNIRARQFRTLMSVDRMIDSVFQTLEDTGQSENTLAVFISDNGFMWGEHGLVKKGVPYTPAIKVPFFLRWPRAIEPGTVDRRIAANIDLVPTVLSVLSEPLAGLDGRDLLDGSWDRDRIQLEYWCNTSRCRPWASTRTKSYQYVEYYNKSGGVEFRGYYNLKRDPWQLRNLLADRSRKNDPKLRPIKKRLAADRVCSGQTGPTACP